MPMKDANTIGTKIKKTREQREMAGEMAAETAKAAEEQKEKQQGPGRADELTKNVWVL